MATPAPPPENAPSVDQYETPIAAAPALTYEQAIERLEGLIERIESGEVGLEEALKQYETGMALIKRCRSILAGAEQKVAELTVGENGEVTVEGEANELASPDVGDGGDRANEDEGDEEMPF